jgi:hypothetical protein
LFDRRRRSANRISLATTKSSIDRFFFEKFLFDRRRRSVNRVSMATTKSSIDGHRFYNSST